MSSTEFSADDYFRTQPPPLTLEHDVQGVRDFIDIHSARGNRVVLVTVSSGDLDQGPATLHCYGTLYPEWRNHSSSREECVSHISSRSDEGIPDPVASCSVRFLDNFSAGL